MPSSSSQDTSFVTGLARAFGGAVAGLLVLGLLAALVYEAVTAPEGPPAIALRADRIVPAGGGYVVEFAAVNEGGTTARALQVRGALYADTVRVEAASATVSWVPAGAERTGGLFFRHDPRRYRLELQPKGYDRP